MRKLDFAFQTMFLSLALLLGVAALTIDRGFAIWILIIQFFLGCQQVLSAFVTSLDRSHGYSMRTKAIRIYWICVAIYFSGLAAMGLFIKTEVLYIWFPTAWAIAVYYYVLTIKLAFRPAEKRSFMDVIS